MANGTGLSQNKRKSKFDGEFEYKAVQPQKKDDKKY
jgi:hypothetical protein